MDGAHNSKRHSRRSLGVAGAVALATTLMACGDAKTAAIVPSPTTRVGRAPSVGVASATTTQAGKSDAASAATPNGPSGSPSGPTGSDTRPTPPSIETVPVPLAEPSPRTAPAGTRDGSSPSTSPPAQGAAATTAPTDPTTHPQSATTDPTLAPSTSAVDKPSAPNAGPTDPGTSGPGSRGEYGPNVTFPSLQGMLTPSGSGPSNLPLDDIIRHLVERDYAGAGELIGQLRGATPSERDQLADLGAIVHAMANGDTSFLANAVRIIEMPANPIAAFAKVAIGVYQGRPVDVAIDKLVPLLRPDVITAIAAQLPSNLITRTHFQIPSWHDTPTPILIAPGVNERAPIEIAGIDGAPAISK